VAGTLTKSEFTVYPLPIPERTAYDPRIYMPLTLIAALSRNNCIGKGGEIPWRLPEDQKRFKELTMGHVVVMGRKTWESIPEKFRPLPGRKNVVLTRQADYALPDGVERFAALEDALEAHPYESVFIIGGTELYAQGLPLADRLELTRVDVDVDGDAFFPVFSPDEWTEVAREPKEGYTFATYERKT
jgi:dihydrofolate reductase